MRQVSESIVEISQTSNEQFQNANNHWERCKSLAKSYIIEEISFFVFIYSGKANPFSQCANSLQNG